MSVKDLTLPLNFGLEDLYEQNNNNAAFILANGYRFRAASLMLGYHSPVIKEKYIKEGILEIDAGEFCLGTVKAFCEAMYCGHLDIARDNFREVNKICQVFEVSWMMLKCLKYFEEALEVAVTQNCEDDLKFLFEEAVYFCEFGRSASLMDILKKKIEGDLVEFFIRKYLETVSNVSNFTLEALIGLTKNHSVFLQHIRDGISETTPSLSNISRFLLLNVNLLECYGDPVCKVTEIFDILLDNEDSADWRMLNKLYRRITKEFLEKYHSREIPQPSASSQYATAVSKYQPFPNLFHYKMDDVVRGGTAEITLENAASISCSMYMLLEYMNLCEYLVTDSVLKKLGELRREKNWTRVHPEFLDTLIHISSGDKNKLKNSANITSTNSVLVVCDKVTTIRNFLTVSATYSFKMRLPGHPAHDNDQEYGFLIKVTGVSRVNQEQFNIQLVVDRNSYPAELQYNGVSGDKLQLVMEIQVDNEWFNRCISWSGRPVDCDVQWGGSTWGASSKFPVRLVVYYNSL